MSLVRVLVLMILFGGRVWADTYFTTNFNKKFYGKAEGLAYTPKVTLLLPRHYRSGKKYPVLYMHDGQNLFDSKKAFGGNEWRVDETLGELVRKGKIEDIIVVGVHNTATRIDDYTPTYISNEYIPNGGGGKLKAYGNFLVKRLKPWVDAHFPTLSDSAHTAVMGSSLGGLASFYLSAWYPDVFGMAGAISPSFWWNQVAVTNDLKKLSFKSRLYMDGGWKEGADESFMVIYMRMVYQELIRQGMQAGKDLMYDEDPKGVHNERDWARRLKQPLLFFFGKTYRSSLKKADILLTPSVIGKGDRSYLTLRKEYADGIFESFPDLEWQISPADHAKILHRETGAEIEALKAGKLRLSTKNGESRDVDIRPISRNRIVIEMTFDFPEGSLNPLLEVYRYRGKKTNYSIPIDFSDPKNPRLKWIQDKGTGIRFKIKDAKGRYAKNSRGRIYRKNLIFRKDRKSRVKISGWQSLSD